MNECNINMDTTNTLYPISTWINNFIISKYFPHKNEDYQCPCKDQTPCTKYFCIQCKVGHLCKKRHFGLNCKHESHPYLQVRKVTHRCAILQRDIKKYEFDTHGIQTFGFNHEPYYMLCSKALPDLTGEEQASIYKSNINHRCKICNASIKTENGDPKAIYCSLQCKLITLNPNTSMITDNDAMKLHTAVDDDKKDADNAMKLHIREVDGDMQDAANVLVKMKYRKHDRKDINDLWKQILELDAAKKPAKRNLEKNGEKIKPLFLKLV